LGRKRRDVMTWDLNEGKWIQGRNTMSTTHRVESFMGTEPAIPAQSVQSGQTPDDEYPGWMDLFEDPITRLSNILNALHAVHDHDHRTERR
jgi:hypothetical protein